jgi:hypothetical protein
MAFMQINNTFSNNTKDAFLSAYFNVLYIITRNVNAKIVIGCGFLVVAIVLMFLGLDFVNHNASLTSLGIWLASITLSYGLLKKPFLDWIGPGVCVFRISSWPYFTLIIVTLFSLAKQFLGRHAAFFYRPLFIVLAPNVYLSSFGLQNISSILFILLAISMLFKLLASPRWQFEAMLRVARGLSFLSIPHHLTSLID